jgi:hypothetical protein
MAAGDSNVVNTIKCLFCGLLNCLLTYTNGSYIINVIKEGGVNMRELTNEQKKLLNEAMRKNPNAQTHRDLPEDVWEKIQKLHYTNVLWTEVDRYLTDAYYKREFSSE